jgi:hypothetical protein
MQLHHTAALLFWISCGLLFYTFAGYGLLIAALARWRGRTDAGKAIAPAASVCVVLVACNEEKIIAERLRNLLASQYPAGKLRILLVSDGSTDGTVAQASSLEDARIEVIERPERAGKAAGLNLAVLRCTADIVVFTNVSPRTPSRVSRRISPTRPSARSAAHWKLRPPPARPEPGWMRIGDTKSHYAPPNRAGIRASAAPAPFTRCAAASSRRFPRIRCSMTS